MYEDHIIKTLQIGCLHVVHISFTQSSEYVNRILLYGFQIWSCQFTGKTNLKYEEAVASEEQALKRLESFPKYFEKTVLQIVHHSKYIV